ncbi:hypothetical protein [Mesorhizobium sp. WSM3859]|uniref:hypothetical protein n=1 Tax=Mesorhizobium sp. WSM3859 TaxID=2029402 RepID=UPI0032AEDF9D
MPPETYVAFRSAFAKGRFFNDHIRDHSGIAEILNSCLLEAGHALASAHMNRPVPCLGLSGI